MSPTVRTIPVVAALLLLMACGDGDGEDVALSEDEGAEQATEEPTDDPANGETSGPDSSSEADDGEEEHTEPAEEGDGGQRVAVFAVREVEGQLWVESEERPLEEATEAVATAAMTQLLTVAPADPGLEAPAGTDVELIGVELTDGVLVVDVSADILDAATGAGREEAFRQALAYTGTQFDTVDAVELRVEGEAITELWGHLDWSEPATPDPFARSPIDVERPVYGEPLPAGPITVSGTSLTFESTVELDLLDPGGTVVEETFTTAAQPDVDQRGPFEHTFDADATEPGTWTIRVREPDPSDGEGRPPYTADIEITIE